MRPIWMVMSQNRAAIRQPCGVRTSLSR